MRATTAPAREDHDTSGRGAAATAVAAKFWLAAVVGLGSCAALGQGAVPCTAIDDAAERLACYDRALRPTPPAATGAQPADASPAASEREPRRTRTVRESAAPAPPAAPAAPSAGAPPTDDEVLPIVIVALRVLPGREMMFTTEDGASWVQTEPQQLSGWPKAPFQAELKRGFLGGYFLAPIQGGRSVRVRQAAAR